jgi:SpoVK/Ycf46/Vps4 family AAA+-type ATPase
MGRKIIISEEQLKGIIREENGVTKDDVSKIVKNVVKQDREVELRVKNIAADVVRNLFRVLWQKNGMYDKDIRQ